LTSVIIGSSVTSIDASAFTGCTALTSVTIPTATANNLVPPITGSPISFFGATSVTVTYT